MDQEKLRLALQQVVAVEAAAVQATAASVDDTWVQAVRLLAACKGKVVFFGVGKAGHIGRKLAASFASLGTPAHFVHAAEAVHGDLGMCTPADVLVALSHSGETAETLAPLPTIRSMGLPVIAITARADSRLAQFSDVVICYPVQREADPLGLAPTASTAAMLAVGDALAVVLAQLRGFSRADFGRFHPGGALGAALRNDRASG